MKLSLFLLSALSLVGAVFGGCTFNGKNYGVGEEIANDYIQLVRKSERTGVHNWSTTNRTFRRCNRCCIWNDPQIFSFDASPYYYNWHGVCRYSLAQYIDDWTALPTSEVPAFGVYGSFGTCSNERGSCSKSCLNITSYQLSGSLSDVVHVDHSDVFTIFQDAPGSTTINSWFPTLVVIGSTSYPLLAWKFGNCLRLLGPQFFIEICENSLCIWTSPIYLGHLGGLCGKYNGYAGDDHTGSSNDLYTWNQNPVLFPPTWKTAIQFDSECNGGRRLEIPTSTCDREDSSKYLDVCRETLSRCEVDKETLEVLIEGCAENVSTFSYNKEEWLQVALDNCNHEALLQGLTIPMDE